MNKIYLDFAATTPVDKRVITAMQPYFKTVFGNPSSLHVFGQQAETALEKSRQEIAESIGAAPPEIIFTSSGSESDNLALRGTAFIAREETGANQLLLSPIEHPAVIETARQMENQHGFEVVFLPVDEYGMVSPDDVHSALGKKTALVSIMHANNEIGTLNPIKEIGKICQQRGVLFHTDAVQGAAHFPLDVNELNVDLLSLGAHKFYGPKGIGALYVREGTKIEPILTGGSQEFGLRASTQNTPLIVGMAKAYQLVQREYQERINRIRPLRDQLTKRILAEVPSSQLTGHPEARLPNHASFVFEGLDGNSLISVLDSAGFACSSGSACKTGDPKPSSVLIQLGYSPSWALGSLRVTLGKDTSQEEINAFLDILPESIRKVRELRN
jgi:cysteine desulfurase